MATISRHLVRCWQRYITFLEQQPCKAQALNTSLLMGTGDIIAQVFLEGKRQWRDYAFTRTARFFSVGFFCLGPSMKVWYTALDKIVKVRSPIRASTIKMLLDQTVFLPPYIASFIVLMSALRLENPKEIGSKLERDFLPILLTSYQLWPAVQMVNFYYVPLQHRILVMNLVGLVWNTYIAWKAERKSELVLKLCLKQPKECQTAE